MNLTISTNLVDEFDECFVRLLVDPGTTARRLSAAFLLPFVMMNAPNLPKSTPAWALSFPEPRSHPLSMSPDALHELLTTKSAAVDFIVVDVRRTDVDVRPFS